MRKRALSKRLRRRILSPISLVLAALAALAALYIFAWPLLAHYSAASRAETEFELLKVPPLAGQIRTRAMEAMVVAWFFMFGGTIGSFLNVVAYRMPLGLSVVWRPSRCPYCETPIRATDNIPVFGWIKIRGRCRTCRLPVSPRYPVVELIMALVFVTLLLAELAPAHAPRLASSPSESAIVTIVLNPLASAIGQYAAHCTLLALLLVWTLMEIDGHAPPRSTLVFAAIIGAAAAIARPLWFAPSGAAPGLTDAVDRVVLPAILGIVGGMWLGAVLLLSKPLADMQRRQTIAALAGGIAAGLFLGWRGAVCAALLSAVAQLGVAAVAPICFPRRRATLLGALFAAVWLLLVAQGALPASVRADLISAKGIQLAAALATVATLSAIFALLAGWIEKRDRLREGQRSASGELEVRR